MNYVLLYYNYTVTLTESCLSVTFLQSIHQNKCPVRDDEYNYHDSVQAHLVEGRELAIFNSFSKY